MTGESLANSLYLVDFDSFLKVLNRPGGFREPGEPEEYCRGFQVFDKDMTGFIGVGQLRYSMFCPGQFGCAWKGHIANIRHLQFSRIWARRCLMMKSMSCSRLLTLAPERLTTRVCPEWVIICEIASANSLSRSCPYYPRQLIPRYD